MNFHGIPNFIAATLTLIAGFVAILKNRKSKINFLFFLLTSSAFIWQLGTGLAVLAKYPSFALTATRVAFFGIALIPVFSYHLSLCISGANINKILIFGYLCAILCFIPLSWTPLILDGVYTYPWGFFFKAGRIHPIFMIFFLYYMIVVFFTLFLSFKRETNSLEKNRKKYFLIALVIAYIGSVDYLPTYGVKVYPFGYLALICFVLIFAYAILRFQIMDINIALTRAAIFAIVYFPVVFIPFWIAPKFIHTHLWWIPILLMGMLATLGIFIYNNLLHRAESRLLAKKLERHDKLRELSSYMMRFTRLKLLTHLIVHNTLKILELKHTALYLLETDTDKTKQFNLICSYGVPQKQDLPLSISLDSALAIELTNSKAAIEFERLRHKITSVNNHTILLQLERELSSLKAHIVIPTFLRLNLTGFLILGESRTQEAFAQEDISVLQVLSNQAALAIENVLFWQKEEERVVEASQEEAVSAVTFGAGHQFNNRLYAISIFTDGLLEMLKDIDQTGIEGLRALINKIALKLQKISEECQFGGQITAGIMGLTGKASKNFQAFDPSPIIASSIEFVEMKHSRDKIEGNRPQVTLTNRISQSLPLIFGSDAQVRDCLFNLIDNAFDADYEKDAQIKRVKGKEAELNWLESNPYSPTIEINALVKDERLLITVTDNGIGIKEEDKKKLFAGYFTTKATSVKGYGKGGHGIGMFTVKKLILAHKGKIYFSSVYGKGTTLTLELPLAKKEDKESNA